MFRSIRTWSRRRWLPLSMITVGVLLLFAVGGYYLYAAVARSQLGELEYTAPTAEPERPGNLVYLYPGSLVPSLYWDNPRWADVAYGSDDTSYEGFTSVDGNGLLVETGTLPAPTRMEIPAISLASEVKELEVVNYGNARGWETPKDVVGHIPTTPHPGEQGNGYYFGHLLSPVRGEGSVFGGLAKIPDQLRKGLEVYVVLYNEEGTAYQYQVYQVKVIPQEEFYLQPSSESIITLVACVPAYVYDHRLLVLARLVGMKKG